MKSNLAESPHQNGEYTYEDYLSWEGDERYELIDGWAYLMAAPSEVHHDISMALSETLIAFFKGKPCKFYQAPFDVRLFPQSTRKRERALVQPDLFVVCDKSKRDGQRINGAPDLVIEILSPGSQNQRRDRYEKLDLYHRAGVREYWIVDPEAAVIQVYQLNQTENWTVAQYMQGETLASPAFPGLELPLREIFPEEA